MKGISDRTPKERDRIEAAWELWDQGVEDHLYARLYFRERGIDLDALPAWEPGGHRGKLPPSIRYHPSLEYWDDGKKLGKSPCLLFAVQDTFGDIVTIQRVWLEPDGSPRKRSGLPDNKNKKLFDGPSPAGCAIRFGSPSAEQPILCVGEGMETMLAVAAATGRPCWSTISKDGLRSLLFPDAMVDKDVGKLKSIVIMADHDKLSRVKSSLWKTEVWMRPGWDAAASAAVRFEKKYKEIECRVCCPGLTVTLYGDIFKDDAVRADAFPVTADGGGVDWLDVYARVGAFDAATVLKADPEIDPVELGKLRYRCGAASVQAAFDDACTLDKVPDEFLHSAPTARAWMMPGGLPRSALMDDPDAAAEEEKHKEQAQRDAERREEVEDDEFPKHSADRARFALERLFTPLGPDGKPSLEARRNSRHTVCHWIDSDLWMIYDDTRYRQVKASELAGHIVQELRGLVTITAKGKVGEVNLTNRAGEDIVKSMASLVGIRAKGLPLMAPPTFDDRGEPIYLSSIARLKKKEPTPEKIEVLVFEDGVLKISDLKNGRIVLSPHSPRYISEAVIPFKLPVKELQEEIDRDPDGEECGSGLISKYAPNFLRFKGEEFDHDHESMYEDQKWYGLCQTNWVHFEKIMLRTGLPGSGKGTDVQAITSAIGEDSVATFKFMNFADKNETYALVGKRLAISTDMRIGSQDMAAAVEQVLTLSSGDPVSTEAKFKDKNPFVYLPIKLMFFSNPVPRLHDPSLALARRLLAIPTAKSFVGIEDIGLKARIRQETLGIMLWSLFGLRNLCRDGVFTQPGRGKPIIEQFKRMSSSMYAFFADVMVIEEKSETAENVIYALYGAWARNEGLGVPSKEKMFGDLTSIAPTSQRLLKESRRPGGGMIKVITGVRPRMINDVAGQKPGSCIVHAMEPDRFADFEFKVPDSWSASRGGPSIPDGETDLLDGYANR